MTLRIIGGERKGSVLASLPGETTRPLLGRVRQSLYDLLREWVGGARMLDLFAGSGAVGLEALSRGARWATFVEADPAALRVLEKNVTKLRYEDRSRVVRGTLPGVLAGLPMPPGSGQPGAGRLSGDAQSAQETAQEGALGLGRYDLVSIMPPYGKGLIAPTLEALMQHPELLAGEGIVVAQFETGEPLPQTPPHPLRQVEARVYGQTHLVFWRWGD